MSRADGYLTERFPISVSMFNEGQWQIIDPGGASPLQTVLTSGNQTDTATDAGAVCLSPCLSVYPSLRPSVCEECPTSFFSPLCPPSLLRSCPQ